MKIFYIIIKEITECSRDIRSLIILLVMPLLLTTILAVTFQDKLSSNMDFSNVKVFYTVNCDEDERPIINEYLALLQNLGIETIDNSTSVKNGEVTSINNQGVTLEINSLSNIKIVHDTESKGQGKLISSLLDTFLKRYYVLSEVAHDNSLHAAILEELQHSDYVIEKSLDNLKTPSSKDYYGIVMITLSFMFSSVMGTYNIMRERTTGTLTKLSSTPISKASILIGKLIGTSIFLFLEGSFILFISNKLLDVYMGPDLIPILLILFSEIIFAVSLGIFIGYVVKDTQSALLFLLTFILIMAFLGGAFIPLSTLNSDFIYKTSTLSLLNYVNTSIFNFIYNKNIAMGINTMILNLVISLILMLSTGAAMEVKK